MADQTNQKQESMQGKHVLMTGGNSGIGKIAAIRLAKLGAKVILACRAGEKTEEALSEINQVAVDRAVNLKVDLGSLGSVRALADSYLSQFSRLDILINNAGILPSKQRITEDGFEMQFGVNHLSHFLLTLQLLDLLKVSQPSRIITVSSMLHKKGSIDFGNFRGEKKYDMQKAYGQSKLANVLFAFELALRLKGSGVTSNVLHPGGVRTDIMRDLPWLVRKMANLIFITPEEGAKTTIMLASDPLLTGVSGEYYDQTKPAQYSDLVQDEALRKRLWQESEQMVGISAS
ncbi:MAG TPA: SDR family oxidoreductase [Pseudomonadales bacterium]|jgi:NAD(P)-dependent dehydrogenase (short-subunit alcohol dehydrogenase family)|nr:short-chain dehydrogenase [Gammaproteobacteria bacterium]MDP6024929.1 SDR family oxidoreductase [Pseudomonadales bacterium]MDP6315691.1 SDR family oxidoreductase [Pseudomonadales bacterium]MDP7313604.1 SDR family oxidoreductase [Pseudomonadales bacterium]HJP51337.1 SDR family oxidoreductase [Pseudomonadales bacterium]|tara:strand:- start:3205 stop:4071 length:867 start_codon:yes stop_codon:yes gene_type:complete